MMGNKAFHELIPEIGLEETRTATVVSGKGRLPPDDYAFLELYCVDAKCDCRRVVIQVIGKKNPAQRLATICHAFEPPGPGALVPEQTLLDPLNPQSRHSEALLEVFEELLLDEEYCNRLERHYRMVKDAVKDPAHPAHAIITAASSRGQARQPAPRVVDTYAPCPCGSGKKYKWCCRDRDRARA